MWRSPGVGRVTVVETPTLTNATDCWARIFLANQADWRSTRNDQLGICIEIDQIRGLQTMAPLCEQDVFEDHEHASSAFSKASVQYHVSEDFRRLIDELASIISRSADQRDHELDKQLGTRPFKPSKPQRAQTASVPSTALPRRQQRTALPRRQQRTALPRRRQRTALWRQLSNRHVVVGVIAVAIIVALLFGGMIHRVWFGGLRNDAPPQLVSETTARVPTSFGVAEQPESVNETTERGDFSASGLQTVPLQRLDDEQIAALIKVGREFIADGKIPIARLVLQRAASAGSAAAALELGGTYDPIILEELGVTANTEMVESTVILPATALARAWYQRAKDLGSVEAPGRLQKLARRYGRPR
jgi:hypothetical protein